MEDEKKYYLYQITNRVNGKIYVGVHQTYDLEDGYIGSGKLLHRAYKKYGIENFEKDILNFFDSEEKMYAAEKAIVDGEFIKRADTYNITEGGKGSWKHTIGYVTVKDINGETFKVKCNDQRYLSGELKSIAFNKISVVDKNGNFYQIDKNDPRYLSGELISHMKGIVSVKDKDGNILHVDKNNSKYLSKELVGITKNKVIVKDKDNNHFMVSKNDPRYVSGELVHIQVGRKHREETKKKIGEKNSMHQRGEGNSQYGKSWIYNLEEKKSIRVERAELDIWISKGWKKGRKQKF